MAVSFLVFPEYAMAFGFENKVKSLTGNLINTVLPLLATLGLVYASVLALSGEAGAKGKVIAVLAMSIVGFLAPKIIAWLKSVSYGGF